MMCCGKPFDAQWEFLSLDDIMFHKQGKKDETRQYKMALLVSIYRSAYIKNCFGTDWVKHNADYVAFKKVMLHIRYKHSVIQLWE